MMKRKKEIIIALVIIATNVVAFTMGMTYGKTQIDSKEEMVEMDVEAVEMKEEKTEENETTDEKKVEEMSGESETSSQSEPSDEVEEATVVDSSNKYKLPEAEAEVEKPKQETPALTPAPKSETISIPDGKGMTLEAYANALLKIEEIKECGFEINAISAHSDTVTKGQIISVESDIKNYTPGNVIQVIESLGPDTTTVKVPAFEAYEEKLPNVPPLMIQYKYSFSTSLENEILKELNAYRAKNGLNALTMDTTLQKAARWKSNAQLQHNYFGHKDTKYGYTPDVIDYVMDGVDTYYTSLSENLHYTTNVSSKASSIVDAWKKSPNHNKNMLEDWWTVVGIGVVTSSNSGSAFHDGGVVLSTQVFGSK